VLAVGPAPLCQLREELQILGEHLQLLVCGRGYVRLPDLAVGPELQLAAMMAKVTGPQPDVIVDAMFVRSCHRIYAALTSRHETHR
jgi:hypothetical protein